MATERLRVILEMVSGQYKREAREAATATQKIGGEADNAGGRITKLGRVGQIAVGNLAAEFGGRALDAVGSFVTGTINAARDLGESMNAVDQVFDETAGTIHAFGRVSAEVVGLSTREFNELAVGVGGALKGVGFDIDDVSTQSIRLTQRAADMASVFNTDVSDALFAIQRGLQGETEPLKRFNVNLSDAEVRAKAVELGLADTTAEVDRNAKATAALELIYEQTNDAAGDFARTSDELANSQRRAAAELENAQARLGRAATGPLTTLTNLGADALTGLQLIGEDIAGLFTGDENQTRALLRWEEAVTAVTQAMANGEDPAIAFQNALLHVAEGADLTKSEVSALAAAAGVNIEDFDTFADSMGDMARQMGVAEEIAQELEDAIRAAGEGSEDAADGIGDAGEAARLAASRTNTYVQEVRNLRLAQLELINPALGAINALGQYQQALVDSQEAIAEYGSESEEAEEAGLDLLESYSRLIGEAQNYAQVAGVSLNDAIRNLGSDAGLTEEQIQFLIDSLNELDRLTIEDKTFTVRALTETVTVGGTTISAGEVAVVSGQSIRRHSGGPGEAGHPYIIKPDEEVFVPHSSGEFVLNDQVIAALRGTSTTNGPTINIGTVYGFDDFAAKVRDAGITIDRLGG